MKNNDAWGIIERKIAAENRIAKLEEERQFNRHVRWATGAILVLMLLIGVPAIVYAISLLPVPQ